VYLKYLRKDFSNINVCVAPSSGNSVARLSATGREKQKKALGGAYCKWRDDSMEGGYSLSQTNVA